MFGATVVASFPLLLLVLFAEALARPPPFLLLEADIDVAASKFFSFVLEVSERESSVGRVAREGAILPNNDVV